jgi:hypothetical protein
MRRGAKRHADVIRHAVMPPDVAAVAFDDLRRIIVTDIITLLHISHVISSPIHYMSCLILERRFRWLMADINGFSIRRRYGAYFRQITPPRRFHRFLSIVPFRRRHFHFILIAVTRADAELSFRCFRRYAAYIFDTEDDAIAAEFATLSLSPSHYASPAYHFRITPEMLSPPPPTLSPITFTHIFRYRWLIFHDAD